MSSNASANKVFTAGPNRTVGTLSLAPAGSDYPKWDATPEQIFGAPGPEEVDLGFLGEDGVSKTEDSSWEEIKEMGGKTVARMLTAYSASFQQTLLQLTYEVACALYGEDNVKRTEATADHGEIISIRATADEVASGVWNLRLKGRKDQRIRIVVPDGQLQSLGDTSFNISSAVSHQITIGTLPDEDGVDFYMHFDDGVLAISAPPTLTAITPSGRGAGQQIKITGTRFREIASVKVNDVALAASAYEVVDARTIIATLPAGAAGTVPVVVTNATGPSAARNYTRIV